MESEINSNIIQHIILNNLISKRHTDGVTQLNSY